MDQSPLLSLEGTPLLPRVVSPDPGEAVLEENIILWEAQASSLVTMLFQSKSEIDAGELEAVVNIAETKELKLINGLNNLQMFVQSTWYLDGISKLEEIRDRLDLLKMRREIAKRSAPQLGGTSRVDGSFTQGHDTSFNSTATRGSKNSKLPKLDLIKFDGDVIKYKPFMGCFETSVHNNHDLSNVEKLQYLQTLYTGQAAELISSYPMIDVSYQLAKEELHQHYGSEDAQQIALFQTIHDIKPVIDVYPTKAVRAILTKISSVVRLLEQLQIPIQTSGFFLVPEIIRKFPVEMSAKFYEKYGSRNNNVVSLLDFFMEKIQDAERLEKIVGNDRLSTKKEKLDYKPDKSKEKQKGSMITCATTQNAKDYNKTKPKSENSKKVQCAFCDEEHMNPTCKKEMSAQEKTEIIKKNKLCFNCLRPGHRVQECRVKFSCVTCGGRHHSTICRKSEKKSTTSEAGATGGGLELHVSANVTLAISSTLQLMMFTANLKTKSGGSHHVRGILDPASHRSYVTKELVNQLRLKKCGVIQATTQRFNERSPIASEYEIFNICIQSRHKPDEVKVAVLAADDLPSVISVADKTLVKKIEELGLELAEEIPSNQTNVDILLGIDVWWLVSAQGRKKISNSLGLINTIFGWVVSGATGSIDYFDEEESNSVTCCNTCVANPDKDLEKLWSMESIGISAGEKTSDFIRDRFEATTTRKENGRYEVMLPVNDSIDELSDNWELAINQLANTLKRIDGNEEHKLRYHDAMTAYVEEEHAEEVPREEHFLKKNVYYIPHHPVIKEDRETTKFRVVFNASSAKKGKKSLNDCLFPGTSLNPDIIIVMIRFRLFFVPVIADIKQAFLQVLINPSHRNFLRFLWVSKDYFKEAYSWKNLWNNLVILRMIVVLFGVNSSPFLLCASIRKQGSLYSETHPREVNALDDGIYIRRRRS